MKVWVVDGHNVIRAAPPLAARLDSDHEGVREDLRRLCVDFARGQGGKVVLVFDGVAASRQAGRHVEVHYGNKADPTVVAQAKALAGPHEVTVVTDDWGILQRVPRGVKRLSSADFWSRLAGSRSRKGSRKEGTAGDKAGFHDPELEAYFLDSEADALRDLPPAKPRRTTRRTPDYRRAAAEGKTKPREDDDFIGPEPPTRKRKRSRKRR